MVARTHIIQPPEILKETRPFHGREREGEELKVDLMRKTRPKKKTAFSQ
jgi:hypothetical protein